MNNETEGKPTSEPLLSCDQNFFLSKERMNIVAPQEKRGTCVLRRSSDESHDSIKN